MIWRLENWLREKAIGFLLDCVCVLLPKGKRYELTIEEVGEDVVAQLTEVE